MMNESQCSIEAVVRMRLRQLLVNVGNTLRHVYR